VVFAAILLPRLLAGPEFAANLQFITIPLLIFMVLLLAAVCVFFFSNYRLLSLLEREDWPALAYYLEQQIYGKLKYSTRKVKLLASSYIVMSDFNSVLTLETKTLNAKPIVVEKNILIFGAARVLSGGYREAAEFFKTYFEKGKGEENQWIRWYYGFSKLLGSDFNAAEPEFLSLAVFSNNALISALSAYFLDSSLANHSENPEKCRSVAENGKKRVVKSIKNASLWKRETDKTGTDIHVAIVRKYIDETGNWLFSEKKTITPTPVEETEDKEEEVTAT
jgi:hypothetical protein